MKKRYLHKWEKVNLVTIDGKDGMYDKYRCTRCGITGKRFGLSNTIRRDKRYADSKYEFCQKKKC